MNDAAGVKPVPKLSETEINNLAPQVMSACRQDNWQAVTAFLNQGFPVDFFHPYHKASLLWVSLNTKSNGNNWFTYEPQLFTVLLDKMLEAAVLLKVLGQPVEVDSTPRAQWEKIYAKAILDINPTKAYALIYTNLVHLLPHYIGDLREVSGNRPINHAGIAAANAAIEKVNTLTKQLNEYIAKSLQKSLTHFNITVSTVGTYPADKLSFSLSKDDKAWGAEFRAQLLKLLAPAAAAKFPFEISFTEFMKKVVEFNAMIHSSSPPDPAYQKILRLANLKPGPKGAAKPAAPKQTADKKIAAFPLTSAKPLAKAGLFPTKQNQGMTPEFLQRTLLEILARRETVEDKELSEAIRLSRNERRVIHNSSLSRNAQQYGLTCHDVPGDGSCFFHAVSDQLRLSGYDIDSLKLREIAVDHIFNNLRLYQEFSENFDKFIQSLLNRNEWADNIMITALSRALNISFVMVRSDGSPPTVVRRESTNYIMLGYEIDLHYQSLHRSASFQEAQIRGFIDRASIDIQVINNGLDLQQYRLSNAGGPR